MMNYQPLDYIPSEQKYQTLQNILNRNWSMLLDSGHHISTKSISNANNDRQYDICVFDPSVTLTFNDHRSIINKRNQQSHSSSKPPLHEMRTLLAEFAAHNKHLKSNIRQLNLPFNGGWVGYISYDFGREQEVSSNKTSQNLTVAPIKMGLYQSAIITDHINQTTALYNFGLDQKKWLEQLNEVRKNLNKSACQKENCLNSLNSFNRSQLTSPFISNMTFDHYSKAFNTIKDYILAGDCYQVNLAQRFSASFSGNPFNLYASLAKENNSPFSSYLNFGDQQILSLSPERFIESHQGHVKTQPIKGTRPRSDDPIIDKQLANQLVNSEKDKAENLMIVDLLRNDLSKTAAKSSVKVTELFGLYSFESVHHLISTVESQLAPQYDNFDLLATTLPGGSITGAPKIRAMQIIEELEPDYRGIYCGIIGYIDFKGNMDTNICIRTLIADKKQLYTWAGGGLIADSQLELEYKETFDKLNKILPLLNKTLHADNLSGDNR